MSQSILTSVKSTLGLPEDYDAFDIELVNHINSAISALTQLGVGPRSGFSITGRTQIWNDFFSEDDRLNLAKQYVNTRVKLLFDPPTPGYVHTAFEKTLDELAWRLTVVADEVEADRKGLE